MNLLNATWVDVARRLESGKLAIIPVGAVEVYGPHLPQGTDGIVALALAEAVSRDVECLVSPLIPVGWSEPWSGFPGTLSVRPESLKAYLSDIVESLLAMGVAQIVILNGHLGNVAVIQEIAQEFGSRRRVRVAQVDLWRFIQPHVRDLMEGEFPFGHASESMTSVMLYLAPGSVSMDRAPNSPVPKDRFPGILRPTPYREATATGALGDATKGTKEKGEAIFSRARDLLIEFLKEF